MTIICAIHARGRTWIGSDTLITTPSGKRDVVGPKWVMRGNWAVGIAGSLRALNVMRVEFENMTLGLHKPSEFASRARQVFLANGISSCPNASHNEGHTECFGQYMILVNRGGAPWLFDASLSYFQQPDDTLACQGGGEEWAQGVGFAMHGQHPEKILNKAIDAACTFSTGCGGKWIKRL